MLENSVCVRCSNLSLLYRAACCQSHSHLSVVKVVTKPPSFPIARVAMCQFASLAQLVAVLVPQSRFRFSKPTTSFDLPVRDTLSAHADNELVLIYRSLQTTCSRAARIPGFSRGKTLVIFDNRTGIFFLAHAKCQFVASRYKWLRRRFRVRLLTSP